MIGVGSSRRLCSVLLASMLVSACGSEQEQANQPQAMQVQVQQLKSDTILDSSEFVGALEADNRVALASRVDGRILEVLVEEGDRVERGQLLVRLQLDREQATVQSRSSQVQAQRANLNNAEAEQRAAQAEYERTKAEVEQRRADLADTEAAIEQQRAEVNNRQAELTLAESEYERIQFLVEQGVESRQTLDQRVRDRDTAEAELEAARRLFQSAQARRQAAQEALNAAIQSRNAAAENVTAAESVVEQEQANLKQAEAEVEVASSDLDYNRIEAPIPGVVGDIIPKPGDFINAGDQITSIVQNQNLSINISVPVEQSPQLNIGTPVEIIDSQGKAITTGQVSFVSPRVSQQQQSVQAKASFINNGSLRDDQLVTVRVIWSESPGVLVPTEAVSTIGGQSFVFVAQEQENEAGEPQMIAQQQPVTLGDIQGQAYQVVSGVEVGDKIITSGILNLRDGVPIEPQTMTSEK